MSVTIAATPREIAELRSAVARWCSCDDLARCGPCAMLADDQRAINGLIDIRRTRLTQLCSAEFALRDSHRSATP